MASWNSTAAMLQFVRLRFLLAGAVAGSIVICAAFGQRPFREYPWSTQTKVSLGFLHGGFWLMDLRSPMYPSQHRFYVGEYPCLYSCREPGGTAKRTGPSIIRARIYIFPKPCAAERGFRHGLWKSRWICHGDASLQLALASRWRAIGGAGIHVADDDVVRQLSPCRPVRCRWPRSRDEDLLKPDSDRRELTGHLANEASERTPRRNSTCARSRRT